MKYKVDRALEIETTTEAIGQAGDILNGLRSGHKDRDSVLDAMTLLLFLRLVDRQSPGTLEMISQQIESRAIEFEGTNEA